MPQRFATTALIAFGLLFFYAPTPAPAQVTILRDGTVSTDAEVELRQKDH
jgi:uncharacterized membrane protein